MTPAELRKIIQAGTEGPWYAPGGGREIVKDKQGGMPITDGSGWVFDIMTTRKTRLANCIMIRELRNRAELFCDLWEAAEKYVRYYSSSKPDDLIEALKALEVNE